MPRLDQEQLDKLSESSFAFPNQRKEPLVDASHVRDAVARFDQVQGVSNTERDEAWRRIVAAAGKFDITLDETDWRELFKRNGRPIPE